MRPDSSFNETGGLQQHSSCHSPLPYLVGGLAAMFGLIVFALLSLACSYWKPSGRFDNNGSDGEQSDKAGEKPLESIRVCGELDEKIVVIMAGDQKPTFIATPMSSKASSFSDQAKEATKSCEWMNGREEDEVEFHGGE